MVGASGRSPMRGVVDRQDPGTRRGHGDGVLPVGRQAAVARLDRPAVRLHPHLVAAHGEHGLDGQAQADLDAPAASARAVVGDLRLLVHLGADAVSHE